MMATFLDRREMIFALGVASLGWYGLTCRSSVEYTPFTPLGLSTIGTVVLEKASAVDAACLEELLSASPAPEPKGDRFVLDLNAARYPQLLYDVSAKLNEDHTKVSITNSTGSALLLNQNGFFLTAGHVLDQTIGNNDNFLLFYDPIKGLVLPAKVFAYSTSFDIALGKVDLPKEPSVPGVSLANVAEPDLGVVYALTYDNTTMIHETLFNEAINSGSLAINPSRRYHRVVFNPKDRLKPRAIKELGGIAKMGNLVTIIDEEGKPFQTLPEGYHRFMTQPINGNSGAAVFDLAHNLTGVLTSLIGGTEKNGKEHKFGLYVDAVRIRDMIRDCIEFSKN